MMEILKVVLSAIVDTYNTVDWGRASEFTAVVRDTVDTMMLIVGSKQAKPNDTEKDDQGSDQP